MKTYSVVGVMSGTSLDGVDLAHILFEYSDNHWQYQILQTQTVPYSEDWVQKLKTAINYSEEQLQDLNIQYTKLLGNIISQFISQNNLTNIYAVCSHGHTIKHQPHKGITLQIGNLPQIATYTRQQVVCNFRVQDVALGGQGAPLVPIGDRILFSQYEYCLNLGGFSNISTEYQGNRIAFDISPVNTVLNFYANQLKIPFDNQGQIARTGTLNLNLFKALNQLEYYQRSFPKSLGFEFVKQEVLPLMQATTDSVPNYMRTFVEHIAYQTHKALEPLGVHNTKMLITGGGAYHTFLRERLKYYLPEVQQIVPDPKTLEYKEALIFGLLGVLRLQNKINTLATVTGAQHDHCSGEVYV